MIPSRISVSVSKSASRSEPAASGHVRSSSLASSSRLLCELRVGQGPRGAHPGADRVAVALGQQIADRPAGPFGLGRAVTALSRFSMSPARADDLLEAVKDLVALGRAGDEPGVVLDSSSTRQLVWRGYLTGGLVTVWLRLGCALRDAEVSAFIGDRRLEVFVPGRGDVAVFGALRRAVVLSWEEWDENVRVEGSVEDLVAGFVHAAMSDAPFKPPSRESMLADDDADDSQGVFPEAARVPQNTLTSRVPS
jgi:hypothetical protein